MMAFLTVRYYAEREQNENPIAHQTGFELLAIPATV
jgi:hypothetical protein